VRDIQKALGAIAHERVLARQSVTRVLPLKRLRNNLCSAMGVPVVMQPVAAVQKHSQPNALREGKHAKQTVVWNPVWDMAPLGAYYKAKKLSSLFTDLALYYTRSSRVAHLLERLSIYVWKMSKRHFNGILRAIRATMWRAFEKAYCPVKSPEALALVRQLTKNPLYKRVDRWNSHRICRNNSGSCLSMRQSYKLGVVRAAYRCTKCTYAACAAKWFTTTV
jgi:hypothetical protein